MNPKNTPSSGSDNATGRTNPTAASTPHVALRSGKTLLASETYAPRKVALTPFVGRENEQRMIVAAWMGGPHAPPLSPVLVGEPGVGKNRLVYEIARQSGRPLFMMQGHEDLTPEDMACAVRFRDDDSRSMEYVASPLLTAMDCGGICFLDEIGKIRPRALALLVSVLDERRYIDSTLLGERVHAQPGFRFIAATNSGELDLMPDFIQSRLRPVIEVGHPPREEIDRIVSGFIEGQRDTESVMEHFWSTWMQKDRLPSPRDAIQHFALATSLCALQEHPDLESRHRAIAAMHSDKQKADLKPEHFEDAFKHLSTEAEE